jgi:hypothetical protein
MMEQDEAADVVDVSFLGAPAEVLEARDVADFVQQFQL